MATHEHIVQHEKQRTKDDDNNVQTDSDADVGDAVESYNYSVPLKTTMEQHAGDFDQSLFSELLTRKDLSHLLYSDIQNLLTALEKEFPEVIKVRSIGSSWQDRQIKVIELDARSVMEQKGIEPNVFEHDTKAKNGSLAQKKKIEEFSQEELLEHNEDMHREEDNEQKQKNREYDSIPDNTKVDVISETLGIDLVQIH